MAWKRYGIAFLMTLLVAVFMVGCGNNEEASGTETDGGERGDKAQETVKIGVLASLTGALEAYGNQTKKGFELGIDYATDGTSEIDGKKIEIIYEDTETDPKVARQKALKLLEEDKVDFLVGSSSSGDTLAVTPLAEEYETVMVVEPAVADSITGSEFNEYIFRTGRNSSQDAVAGAAAIAKEGVKIAHPCSG